ncbi:uncharacterized protein LOC115389280 [Salarias fasciatus]|uniref:uncharacterized protein LOC115389280 n=1 Tax=Salarias fasciatus TaxID=181472 RepID=UPI0011764B74|nr:uncharacterized protein LOC115389280 [Salarias fasciatus]
MATAQPEPGAGAAEEHCASSESNEHDYAHAVETTFSSVPPAEPQPGDALPIEMPEPAVGAEVDCPIGNDVEVQSGAELQKTEELADFSVPKRFGRWCPKRPEDQNCACCRMEFERQGRSFNRRAVYTFTSPDTVMWAFPGSAVHERSFLCEACAQTIRSKCKRKQSGRRSLWLKPPAAKQSQARDKKLTGRRMGKKSKAALLVSKSSYKAAFQMLWSAKGARKPMMEFWSKQLKEEMKLLSRHGDSPFHQKVSGRKPLTSFPWRKCLNWAQDKAPLVTTCLRSLFPDLNALFKSNHQLTEEQAFTLLERRTVVALSIPLFTRNIWKNNFLQAALGAELRLQGCSGSALDTLNTMGLCQNKDTVRLLLHRLRNGKDMSMQDDEQGMKQEELKGMMGETLTDVQEVDMEVEEEDDDEEEEEEEEEEEDDEEEEEEDIAMVGNEEVEEEEVQGNGDDDDDEEEEATAKEEKKRRKKKAKKQRKEEKRKARGKRKAKEREEEEEDEEEEEGSEEKKRRVVVVRLGLLKGHSEVGRSDLSAP